ncbi:ATP-dependent helicase [Sodalinema gerasimenkoae]|uniref:ATP-dependent helicase n=1 Tax=Sodalinema gerasimenkoae TaxID=2862348 RepID=UPI00135C2EA8|nr:ATP-dependent helicase [Sodalinema gerasimenkoae]
MTSPESKPSLVDRPQLIQDLRNSLRPGQQEMGDWQNGPLAVSAVPGSGKSTGMAIAAALTIARQRLHPRHQLLIVTFTRSAAANIKAKIRQNLELLKLPKWGFSVSTIHGLAFKIAGRHPEQSGLDLNQQTLIEDNHNQRLIRSCVEQWINEHPHLYQPLITGIEFDGEEAEQLRRQSVLRTDVLPNLAQTVIQEAKSSGLSPDQVAALGQLQADPYSILEIGAHLYDLYQQRLRSQQLIDYNDAILAALNVLDDPNIREHWQQETFAVFEDEAQDSSPLQQQLLDILAQTPDGTPNLIRVGDPNQAINSTFTPADPIYFRRFCHQCHQQQRQTTIQRAGRSSPILIEAANFTLTWINQQWRQQFQTPPHPGHASLPFEVQFIEAVTADDPQPNANPAPIAGGLQLHRPFDISETVDRLAQTLTDLFAQHPQATAAVLVRQKNQGQFIASELSQHHHHLNIYHVEAEQRLSGIPLEMLNLLQFVHRPHSGEALKGALEVFVGRQLIPRQDLDRLASLPERFLYPTILEPPQPPEVKAARRLCCALLQARLELPQTHLIGFFALTLDYSASELATADKLNERLLQQTSDRLSLGEFLDNLFNLVTSQPFDRVDTDLSDSQYTQPGRLTILTMHKAKGLDWDFVFLPFLHENMIPGELYVKPQIQFLGNFTLEEVARGQLRQHLWNRDALDHEPSQDCQSYDDYWQLAAQLKQAEEYRLFYVAMTRAKRLLWLSAAKDAPFTWNKTENLQAIPASPPFNALCNKYPDAIHPTKTE